MHRITIGIITYKRPELLARTLDSLAKLEIPAADVRLLVVDNDPGKSAKPIVDAKSPALPFATSYAVEEQTGIPHARNKVLSLASDSHYIAFIDDDDTADPHWLAALYEASQRYEADVVMGVIHYHFPKDKAHLAVLDIFANQQAQTGEHVSTAWTNNVLFSTHLATEMKLQFDLSFIDTGGSDNHFFKCAHAAGAKLVMCREAIVHSNVPLQRTSWRWLALRHLRVGATMTMSEVKQYDHRYAMRQIVRSFIDSNKYIFRLLPGVFTDPQRIIHPIMVLFFTDGRIIGLFKLSPHEYKK